MTERYTQRCDVLIAGAGFAGSIMALILNNLGFNVALVEKESHPRFAIGESSTPVADLILRELSAEYNLPWLKDLSRYGSWQQAHPEIICGIKRGFSYFKHYPGKEFKTDSNHSAELLVAASTGDLQSDTNWLRADFDAFLVEKVKGSGIAYVDGTEIISAERNTDWLFYTEGKKLIDIKASFFIDATGSGNLLEKMFGVKSSSAGFLTDSFAVFSHFDDVPRWTDVLQNAGIPTGDFPYDPDNSALHHVLDEGWVWMLRFNDRRTSIGFALNGQKTSFNDRSAEQIWKEVLERYPAIHSLLKNVELSPQPGKILKSARLQRKAERCFGAGWAALPHTAGFVDALFSSGIAHSLTGIKKMAILLKQHWGHAKELQQALEQYELSVFEELKLIDKLVAGCYDTMHCFGLFNAWSMLYFAATITSEQKLLQQKPAGYFLGADDSAMRNMIDLSYLELTGILQKPRVTDEDIQSFTDAIRQRIAPVNIAGLLDPALKNMYHHTAVRL